VISSSVVQLQRMQLDEAQRLCLAIVGILWNISWAGAGHLLIAVIRQADRQVSGSMQCCQQPLSFSGGVKVFPADSRWRLVRP
jgi:hypothetical protein